MYENSHATLIKVVTNCFLVISRIQQQPKLHLFCKNTVLVCLIERSPKWSLL